MAADETPDRPDEKQAGAESPRHTTEPPKDDAPEAPDPGTDSDPDSVDEADQDTVNQAAVLINVHGNMYADGASIGDQDGRRTRSHTGAVDDATLRQELRYFVDPPLIAEARAKLLEHGVVVLAGEEGTGRRCASLALLAELPASNTTRPVVVLSPTWSTERLAAHKFQRHGRYVLADHLPDDVAAAQRRYELDLLRDNVRSAQAMLVITAVSKDRFGDLAVGWRPVSGERIFDAYLAATGAEPAEPARTQVRDRMRALTPREARLLLRKWEEAGVDAALRSAADTARENVRTWLAEDDYGTKLGHLLPLVAAAFVHGGTRRAVERCCVRLRRIVDEHAGLDLAPATDEVVPTRLNRSSLLHISPPDDDPFGEPTVRMSNEEHHEAAFAELVDRYGPELWEPVREWHLLLPGMCNPATRNNVAIGTAVFARLEPAEVRRVLDVWADGTAEWRTTAALTLHWMCQDSRTSAHALAIASRWCSGAGQRRAVTAALALALDLSANYPNDSIARLWQLALRAQVVSGWARAALSVLAHRAAEAGEDRLGEMLRILRKQLRHLGDTRRHDHRAIRKAIDVVHTVLRAPAFTDVRLSITLHVLRDGAPLIPIVGELWAAVIAHFPHRDLAIEDLRDTFDEMYGPKDAAAVQTLGAAVRAHLDEEAWLLLCRDLPEGEW